MEVTQQDLTAALISARDPQYSDIRFSNYSTSNFLARDLLTSIQNTQRVNSRPQPDPAFTEVEIAKALADYGYGHLSGINLARSIADIIEKKRARKFEPAWIAGDVVRSAKDKVLVRTTKGDWYRPEDGQTFPDHRVRRPLTTLLKG